MFPFGGTGTLYPTPCISLSQIAHARTHTRRPLGEIKKQAGGWMQTAPPRGAFWQITSFPGPQSPKTGPSRSMPNRLHSRSLGSYGPAHVPTGFLGQDSRRKTLSTRTTEGGLTLAMATGLPTLAIRPRSAIKKSVSAPVPKKRSATSKALP